MSGGGSRTQQNRPGANGSPFSWAGATSPSTFDTKNFGTQIAGDLDAAYKQGPQVNPISSYTPFSSETTGLINNAQADNAAIRNGLVGDVAAGNWLSGGNPFFEKALSDSLDNTMTSVNSLFNNSGRFGGGSHVDTLANSLGTVENNARLGNFENEYNRMLQGQQQLAASNSDALGYSGLIDSKAAEKTAADQAMWEATHNAPFNHIQKYLALQQGTTGNTNQPASGWDWLGTLGTVAGAFL